MIKVLVVDDSALIRSLLGEIVKAEKDMLLVGAAPDAYIARELVNRFSPDVITLDIEMPKVDGLTFLEKLMKARPTPVVMISTLTEQGAEATLRALELGAIDFIAKPKLGVAQGIEEYRALIVEKIRLAANTKVKPRIKTEVSQQLVYKLSGTEKIIALGASTGGTVALKEFLMHLPANSPAVVITQHMPPGFTTSFAQRLNSTCKINVHEVTGGERILPGNAYLAPGNFHLTIVRHGSDYRTVLSDGDRVSGHKPSVDVMFNSLAKCAGENTVAVLMTGMGKDGAAGMLALRGQGSHTLAQNEETCVVFGMPREAINLGAVVNVLPLSDLASEVLSYLQRVNAGSRL
ncbi:protein-glutamate methylesterase/protein-glutamine glutaminase [Shewanella sp. TC10]|uniref:protein-glutamate methylesterase/protein-glutamine glutaminase n=1 Tax=Shewanella sp. TC10 TaxID=1419739 RepID=UPI00129ECE56|nr:chemotaxis response regulator protein-glutamate methylesterase [Shewanella sp. TC10]